MIQHLRTAILTASTLCLFGCNPFIENYRGETFPRNTAATAIAEQPTDATKIGESVFYSIDDYSKSQAVAAAEHVGADFVVWEKKEASDQKDWVPQPMMIKAGTATTTAVNIPVPVTRMWYEYAANFYRKTP